MPTLVKLLVQRTEKLVAQLDDGTYNLDRFPFRDAVAANEIAVELRRRLNVGRLRDLTTRSTGHVYEWTETDV